MSDGNEKKVIVLSPAGSKVKSSDITRVTPEAQQDDVSDPMKSRDTDTASFKKVDPAMDDGKSRKTIKLKPLKPKDSPQEEAPKAAPIPLDAFKTSPSAIEGVGGGDEDETVKIDKAARQAKPAEQATTGGMLGGKQTIKLRPSSSTVSGPEGAEGEGPKPTSPSTLKLKPITISQEQSAPPPQQEEIGPGFSEEQTVSMQKKTIKLSPTRPTPGLPEEAPTGAGPTVKLTPTTVQPPPSVPTVKLMTTPQAEAPQPPQQEAAGEAKPSPKRTLKLKSAHVPAPEAPPAQDLSQTGQQVPIGQEAAGPEAVGAAQVEKGADEPNIIFTIAACVAFLALAYFSWMVIGQYGEKYFGWQTANVPGLSGKAK